MVDPNRKINRLTEDHVQFLDEIEEEFADRFSPNDEDFMRHCAKPPSDPPVVPNWSNANKQRFTHAPPRYRNNRDWAYRRDRGGGGRGGGGGGDGGGGRHHHRRSNHYEGRNSNGGGGGGHRGGGGGHQPRSHPPRREENFAPMNIPRNYANFVAASKD